MGLAGQSRWQQGVLRAQWPQLMALTVLSRLCSPGVGALGCPCSGSRAGSCLLLLTDELKVLRSGFLPCSGLMELAGSTFWS